MNYILMEYADKNNFTASSKARDDAAEIIKKSGAEFIPLYQAKSGHSRILFSIVKNCFSLVAKLKKGDHVFIQYPYNPQIVNKVLIGFLAGGARGKKADLCILMHDINSFRFTDNAERSRKLKEEAALLGKAQHVIAHNTRMIKLFRKFGCKASLHNLEMFDYLYEGPEAEVSYSGIPRVIIAGNLLYSKCGYIYDLPDNGVDFALYGVNFEEDRLKNSNVVYEGAFPPDDLIPHLKGTYGLVWDGPSPETCAGNFGTYLKYNDPHKFSLYIASGIPVIVWEKSALASVVKERGIGLVISSLSEIAEKAALVTEQDYQQMRDNVRQMRQKITAGGQLTDVVTRICSEDGV